MFSSRVRYSPWNPEDVLKTHPYAQTLVKCGISVKDEKTILITESCPVLLIGKISKRRDSLLPGFVLINEYFQVYI